MAAKKTPAGKAKKVTPKKATAGKQTIELKVLDAATKEKVLKCIQERGKITISIKNAGVLSSKGDGFAQSVD